MDFNSYKNTSCLINDKSINPSASPRLTAKQTAGFPTFRWLDCDNNNAVIPGETEQSYTARVGGNYAVKITIGVCA